LLVFLSKAFLDCPKISVFLPRWRFRTHSADWFAGLVLEFFCAFPRRRRGREHGGAGVTGPGGVATPHPYPHHLHSNLASTPQNTKPPFKPHTPTQYPANQHTPNPPPLLHPPHPPFSPPPLPPPLPPPPHPPPPPFFFPTMVMGATVLNTTFSPSSQIAALSYTFSPSSVPSYSSMDPLSEVRQPWLSILGSRRRILLGIAIFLCLRRILVLLCHDFPFPFSFRPPPPVSTCKLMARFNGDTSRSLGRL